MNYTYLRTNAECFFMFTFICRRTNELKAEIDIPDDTVMKFRQFWSDFKDTPLKGAINFHRHYSAIW